jgi:hypothetical protein
MNPISFEQGLLVIALIIASVSLFLSLFNALILIDLSKKITALKNLAHPPAENTVSSASFLQKESDSSERGKEGTHQAFQQKNDTVVRGIRSVIDRYAIDSIVVSMTDGLVVTSVDSSTPEYDAAHYSSMFKGKYTQPEQGILLIPLEYRGITLIGIARTQDTISEGMISHFAREMRSVVEQDL